MHRFAKSAYARNMWRIMKEFKVLPNDPLLRSLSAMERDFIIEEMNYDNKIKEMISKGQDPNTAVEDDDEEYTELRAERLRVINQNLLEDYTQTYGNLIDGK